MSSILITGATGQVGRELQQTLASLGQVIPVDRSTCDLAIPEQVRQVVQDVRPIVIVNAAAYTAVDRAESEPSLAHGINGTAVGILSEEAKRLGAALIHISTDYVFNGRHHTPYLEQDTPDPLGVYGQSKLAGEEKIQQLHAAMLSDKNNLASPYLILRTAWVYGTWGKSNFVKTMLRLGAEREEIRVVADQIGSPTWSRHLADSIAKLTPQLLSGSLPSGVYHFTNSGVASWYDFAVAIFEQARSLGFPLKVQRVIPIATSDYPTPACRPAYSVLSCRKLTAASGEVPAHWQQALRQMLAELYQVTYESTDSERR